MARDRGGFEQGRRKCPTTGKPLKLMSQPSNAAYRNGWERTFGVQRRGGMSGTSTLEVIKKGKRNG